ncbi:MAG: NADH:ubiquinone oxidoreductase subunit NDUFA12 [Alphaproteobacteria bacterium]|nr:NADH:ubiquinone oxidoreductase subunit NDUFA12 [Alphaproteobacteria bacterium]MBF0251366.1 NADH:ubiquinone oxidoreductase subunit NDUFA12 [Alphaproteobacteria bacterium]
MDIGSIGTRLYTMMHGEYVGTDDFGNTYYRYAKTLNGRERRWVIYKGRKEASKVPPEWHAWLHHTTAAPLSEAAVQPKDWQETHIPNMTGTLDAYRPHEATAKKAGVEAWSPGA